MSSIEEDLNRYNNVIRRGDAEEKERNARFNYSLRKVLSTDDGRRVLKVILNQAPLRGICYSNDALALAFFEGRRSVTANIEQLIPKDLLNQIEECIE